jgi:hypothetical protein
MQSCRESNQRAAANNAPATRIPQRAVVAMPSGTDPPYASSRPSIGAPPHHASAHSMSGTATQASTTVAATKHAASRQFGGGVARAPRWLAAWQHSRNPRSASPTAAAIAIAPITPRDPWPATSSNEACGTR